jgi:hypothetical protein
MEHCALEKPTVAQLIKEFPVYFMKREFSLRYAIRGPYGSDYYDCRILGDDV